MATNRKKQTAKPSPTVQAENTPVQPVQATETSIDWHTLPLTPVQASDYTYTTNLVSSLRLQLAQAINLGHLSKAKEIQDTLDLYSSRLMAYDCQVKAVQDCQKLKASLTKGESMLNSLAALLGL